jgi:hypothetical protein
MHAIKLITPGVMVAMALGLVAFWLIYRYIFTDRRKK